MVQPRRIKVARSAIWLAVGAAVTGTVFLVSAATSTGGASTSVPTPLVFARGAEHGGGLYTVRPGSARIRRLTSGHDEAPAWSPDGDRVVFSRMKDHGRSYEIFTVTTAGKRVHALTPSGGFALSPSWTPDGTEIVFSASGGRFGQSGDRNCEPSVWLIRPDGRGLHRLLTAGVEPAFSPDGRRIAFVRIDARDRPWLYIASASGHGAHRLGPGAHPSWSPDGRHIVVERGVGLNRIADLWILRTSDGHAKRLTDTPTLSEQGPAWSPDGQMIAFSMVDSGRQNIFVIPAGGGRAHTVTRTSAGAGNFEPAWAPSRAALAQPVGVLAASQTLSGSRHVLRLGHLNSRSPAVLVGITAEHRAGSDRVVLRFAGTLPTRRQTTYVKHLLGDASGRVIPVSGRAVLRVILYPAVAHDPAGRSTAPARAAYALPNVTTIVRAGDFESVLTLGIGLAKRSSVHVMALRNPSRVVIDIRADFRTVLRRVYLFDQVRFNRNRQPFVSAVLRPVPSRNPATGVMDRLFAGPTATEYAHGLRLLNSRATGYAGLTIGDGVARVRLTGGCSSGGSTVSIADLISPTLRQFPGVRSVKILDPAGQTEIPAGSGDSRPLCLEP